MEELKKKIEEDFLKEIAGEKSIELRYQLIQAYSDFVMVGLRQQEINRLPNASIA